MQVAEPVRKEVVIVDTKDEEEPKPGTSKDEDFSELTEPGKMMCLKESTNKTLGFVVLIY